MSTFIVEIGKLFEQAVQSIQLGIPEQLSVRGATLPSRCSLPYSHEQFLVELGRKLRQMRIDRGWSLRDMIAQHGFHLAHWQGFEKGKGVSVRSLLRLCDVFEISLEDLIAGLGRYPANGSTAPAVPEISPAATQAIKKSSKAKAVRSAP